MLGIKKWAVNAVKIVGTSTRYAGKPRTIFGKESRVGNLVKVLEGCCARPVLMLFAPQMGFRYFGTVAPTITIGKDNQLIHRTQRIAPVISTLESEVNNEIYKINTSVVWAKGQLQILADMAESEGLLSIRDEAIRIKNGLRNLQQEDAADRK